MGPPRSPAEWSADVPEAAEISLRAEITQIRFSENGFLIAAVRTDEGRQGSVVGPMMEPKIGQLYEFTGTNEYNERFRQNQLRFHTYRPVLPDTNDGILRYLVQTARWVGPATARALVEAHGTDTLRIIREEPDKIGDVPGLTADRIKEMQLSLLSSAATEAAMIEVGTMLGGTLGPSAARKAVEKWGESAARLIRHNPFILTRLRGVGFLSADAVYRKLGLPEASPKRHARAILHALEEIAGKEGHTLVTDARVRGEASRWVGKLSDRAVPMAARARAIVQDQSLAIDNMQLGDLAAAEEYAASKVRDLADSAGDLSRVLIDQTGMAADQQAAADAILEHPVSILTGAPGTGKTWTLARAVQAMERSGLRVALCAPTGKAAKQMSQALAGSVSATPQTIHSALEAQISDDGEFSFARNELDPLDAHIVVADEFSMVDARLARSLLRAIRPPTRLLIVGDHYQLPSVGPGAVLRDLIDAGVPMVELTEIKRNAGLLVRQCHAMKAGRTLAPADRLDLDAGLNWRHVEAGSPDEILAVVRSLLVSKLPALGIEPKWDSQLISPTNERGQLSCEALNKLARSLLNPCETFDRKLPFGEGDKIVRCKNGRAKSRTDQGDEVRIVNGDLGIAVSCEQRKIAADFRFPDRQVWISRAEHQLKLAYCLTCHKMQGSEVPVVILPLHSSFCSMPMFNREWLYTAFSRAKRFIVTIGDLEALERGIRKVGNRERRTSLRERLIRAGFPGREIPGTGATIQRKLNFEEELFA